MQAQGAKVEMEWRTDRLVLAGAAFAALLLAAAIDDPALRMLCQILAAGLLGWLATAGALTLVCGLDGLAIDLPEILGDFHALSQFLVALEITRGGGRWPSLFLTVRIDTWSGERELPSPSIFVSRLGAAENVICRWRITARARGPFEILRVAVSSAFPGSPVSLRFQAPTPRRMLVLPAIYRLNPRTLELLRGRRGDSARLAANGQDVFAGVRMYRAGDNPRLVHYGLSLRMPDYPQQLVLREFEDTEADDVSVLLDNVLLAGEGNELTMRYRREKAICFTLALCELLAGRKYRVQFWTVGPSGAPMEQTIHHPARDIALLAKRLATLEPFIDQGGFGRVARRELGRVEATALLIALRDEAIEQRHERLPVFTITPDLQTGLTREVVGI